MKTPLICSLWQPYYGSSSAPLTVLYLHVVVEYGEGSLRHDAATRSGTRRDDTVTVPHGQVSTITPASKSHPIPRKLLRKTTQHNRMSHGYVGTTHTTIQNLCFTVTLLDSQPVVVKFLHIRWLKWEFYCTHCNTVEPLLHGQSFGQFQG